MCLPVLAALPLLAGAGSAAGIAGGASAALGIGSSILGFMGGQALHHSQVEAANLNYAQKFNSTEQEAAQLGAQQSEQNLTDSAKAAQSFGHIAASASDLGIGGYSLSNLFGADATAAQRTQAITDANYQSKFQAVNQERQGANMQRTSEIASADAAKPSVASLVLGIGKGALSGATTYAQLGGKF